MSEKGPRSAVEIVMERLRQKDVADGVEHRPRTEQQKAAIAPALADLLALEGVRLAAAAE